MLDMLKEKNVKTVDDIDKLNIGKAEIIKDYQVIMQ